MKRSVALVLSLLLGTFFLVFTGPAATADSYCGITWGSLADAQHVRSLHASVTNVRGLSRACYDRLEIDVRGDIRGFDVRYVCVVLRDGTAGVVPLRGGADLQIIALAANHTGAAQTVYRGRNDGELLSVTGFGTFRQVAYAGGFSGQTNIGLGVRAPLPFRAFILEGPGAGTRLIVDVAHKW